MEKIPPPLFMQFEDSVANNDIRFPYRVHLFFKTVRTEKWDLFSTIDAIYELQIDVADVVCLMWMYKSRSTHLDTKHRSGKL